jgi:hypothetical protein
VNRDENKNEVGQNRDKMKSLSEDESEEEQRTWE